jgi:hypothetical protein
MQVLLAIEEAALQAILSVWLSMDSNATPAAATEPAAATKLAEGRVPSTFTPVSIPLSRVTPSFPDDSQEGLFR